MAELVTTEPKGSRFGWPKPSRIEEFNKLTGSSNVHHQMLFKGQVCNFPIIRVSIDLPKYRLENGRTTSAQEEYLAKHPTVAKDLFNADPELWNAQESQHRILVDMAKLSDLQQYFEDPKNIQTEVIILDENGFVINGNRRLATWRELVYKDKAKFSHFENIDVVVLTHCDSKEIDRIEARLQITRDIRADYSWDARAKMMQAKQKRDGFSNKELAEMYDMAESEIKESFDMLAYAEEYLKSRGKEGFWSLVSNQEHAFKKIAQNRPKITTLGKQELFKELAFVLIDKPEDAGGRLYDQIPAIYQHLETVTEKFLEKFPITEETTVTTELDELLGGKTLFPTENTIDIALAKEIATAKNVDVARELLVETLETQKQLKKDKQGADFLIKCCAKAQSALTTATANLKAEAKTDGVENQLDAIEELVSKIRAYVKKNANA